MIVFMIMIIKSAWVSSCADGEVVASAGVVASTHENGCSWGGFPMI